jgi:coatomer subunit beta'
VHPTQPFVLTGSDDMTIKLWNWDQDWKCVRVFEGHAHYVMSLAINPKDPNTFASSCLDRTVKVWSFTSSTANYTLDAHDKGVNHVDYYHGNDKPYLITTGDDKLVKIWDYQTKACIQTLEGHTSNVSFACFHPTQPIIVSGSEDGTVKVWHANTYRLEQTLNYGLERAWCVAYLRGRQEIGMGFDEGVVVIKMGREEPAVSMDSTGKIVWAKYADIETAIVKPAGTQPCLPADTDGEIKDGARLPLSVKELGSSEIYPQTLAHSPNGRFIVATGDGEYIIYTALRLNNKAFGPALDFVWASNSNEYAIRESATSIRLYKNFKERLGVLNVPFSMDGLFGGQLVGVKGQNWVCFYDWDTGALVRRIDEVPKNVTRTGMGLMAGLLE